MHLESIFLCLFFTFIKCDNNMKAILKFDYCKLKCGKTPHSACDCSRKAPRKEITNNPDIVTYRKVIVDIHNQLRNKLACGNETRPPPDGFPSASNMMLINYDLEMEHIARCYALHSYNMPDPSSHFHDSCRNARDKSSVGQNGLRGDRRDEFDKMASKYNGTSQIWYDEVKYLTNNSMYKKLGPIPNYHAIVLHFTQFIKWAANRIGCVRVEHPGNMDVSRFSLFCNYGTTTKGNAANVIGVPVYQEGVPCSACPKGFTCNTKYPCLCGEEEPIPQEIFNSYPEQNIVSLFVNLAAAFLLLLI